MRLKRAGVLPVYLEIRPDALRRDPSCPHRRGADANVLRLERMLDEEPEHHLEIRADGIVERIEAEPLEGAAPHERRGMRREDAKAVFWGAPKSLQMVTAAVKLKDAFSLEEKL